MLNIYYTGADRPNTAQASPSASLGGYVSSSSVPNDFLGNLFGGISQLSKQLERSETRVIAVQNNSGSTFTSFDVYIDLDDPNNTEAEYAIGFQQFTLDDCADLVVETLPNGQSSPLNVTMETGTGVNNKITLPNLANQEYVAIYIRRTTKNNILSDDECATNFEEGITLPTTEIIDLVFNYT